jgi:citrate lyase gamma subunit
MTKSITRRTFIKNTSSAAIAGALYLNTPIKLFADESNKSRVVLIRDEDILNSSGKPKASNLEKMLDEAVRLLTNEEKSQQAWQQIIKPEDTVGIKSNVNNYVRTPFELEEIIQKRVENCGVPSSKISIDDRGVLGNNVFLNSTALINTRPMRAHAWSGVGSLLKNYIMFDEKPSKYHPDSCADLAKLWKLPITKGKTRLNILVMLTPLFHGTGPHLFNPKYSWAYNGLLVGFDPVAVDSIGVKIIQAKREQFFGEHRPINPPAKHIFLADTRHHLGNADPNKIEIIKLGWEEDILI